MEPTRIYFDTEFSSLWDPQPISIGFVTANQHDGLYFEFIHDPVRNSPFTERVVIPRLRAQSQFTPGYVSGDIRNWLASFGEVELVCDFIGDFWILRSFLPDVNTLVTPRCARNYRPPEPAVWKEHGLIQHNARDDALMMAIMKPALQVEG